MAQRDTAVTLIPQDQIDQALLDAKMMCLRFRTPPSEIETLLVEIRTGFLA